MICVETANAADNSVHLPAGGSHLLRAVVSVASDGRRLVTRPGSFGDRASLIDIAAYLSSAPHPQISTTHHQEDTTMTPNPGTAALPVVGARRASA